jgi:hypothetical protein
MGLFKRLFRGEGAGRGGLDKVCRTIASGLEQVRRGWFEGCIRNLREAAADPAATPAFRIQRTMLSGGAERAMKAYQVHTLEDFCARHMYVPGAEQQEFCNTLRTCVFGPDHAACAQVLSRYAKASSVSGPDENTIGLLVDDIITWIAGEQHSNSFEQLVVLNGVDSLGTISAIVAADAFGDAETGQRIRATLSSAGG